MSVGDESASRSAESAESPGASFEESYWTSDSHYRKFEDYDAALRALRVWHQGLFRLLGSELPAGGQALDAGCGHGAMVHELLDRGFDARGIDLSNWVIEEARRAEPALAERFSVGDVSLPVQRPEVDLVTCLEVLEHVPDPRATLTGLASRLRPGGRLIATTPNRRPLIPWWDPVTRDPTHVSVHEAHWWRGCLESAGLEVRRVATFLALPVLWRLHPALARWIPMGARIGPGVLIVASVPG